MFRLFLGNRQRKHIIFAGLHDEGYTNILKPFQHDPEKSARITLLETLPAPPAYKELGFKIVAFDNVFNKQEYNTPAASKRTIASPHVANRPLNVDIPPWIINSGAQKRSNSVVGPGTPISPTLPILQNYYLVNASGERVDIELPPVGQKDLDDLTDFTDHVGKLCNSFYLTEICTQQAPCSFKHETEIPLRIMLALRHQARSIPCGRRTRCRNANCVQGHNCSNEVRLGRCDRGTSCKFEAVHSMDRVCSPPSKHDVLDY